jgi:putative ABC transport system substrate-binding protein
MLTVCFTIFPFTYPADAADVIILGDTKLKPVSDVVKGIHETIHYETVVKSPEDIKENLEQTFKEEGAKAVIVLGKNAVNISSDLPESVPVIYGLIINPIETERQNITGVYMMTPISEYVTFINKYFPAIEKIGVVCTHEKQEHIDYSLKTPKVEFCNAKNPYEFTEGINSLGSNVDALLLLPEKDLITTKTLKQLYLFSFKEKVPIIGISEKYVKIGSLFSLGFDTTSMGRQIGALAKKVVLQGSTAGIPPSPPDSFNLHINRKTSETMRVNIPSTLLNTAKKVYP